MSVLLQLPQDLYNYVCTEWLELISLAFLDSAVCQRNIRQILLNQLENKSVQMNHYKIFQCYYVFDWIRYRKLKIVNLFISSLNHCRNMLDKWNNWKGIPLDATETLQITNFDCINPQVLVCIFNRCTKVSDLNLSSISPLFNWEHCPKIFNQLTSLTIESKMSILVGNVSEPTSTYIAVSKYCKNLQSFTLYAKQSLRVFNISPIFMNNPNLEFIEVLGTSMLFAAIIEHCHNFNHLEFLNWWAHDFQYDEVKGVILANVHKDNFYFKYACYDIEETRRIIYSIENGHKSLSLKNISEFEFISNFTNNLSTLTINGLTDELIDVLLEKSSTTIKSIVDYDASRITIDGLSSLLCMSIESMHLRKVTIPNEEFFSVISYSQSNLHTLLVSIAQFAITDVILLFNNCAQAVIEGEVIDMQNWPELLECLNTLSNECTTNFSCTLRNSKCIYFDYNNGQLCCLNVYGNVDIQDELVGEYA